MDVTIARTAGFCFGVKKAIEISQHTRSLLPREETLYTYGPLIHNQEVIQDLESQGILARESIEDLPEDATVVLRAHGVGESVYRELQNKNIRLVDATCPFVGKIHRIVRRAGEEGSNVIIVGDPSHPEVQGIRGWCLTPAYIYRNPEELKEALPPIENAYTLVAQTTLRPEIVSAVVELLQQAGYNLMVHNTICSATLQHQEEAKELSRTQDAIIVIGGRHSSNTCKLYELCLQQNPRTFLVETAQQTAETVVPQLRNSKVRTVGITAGASTPDATIQEVAELLRKA